MHPPNLLPGRNRFTTQRVQKGSYLLPPGGGNLQNGQIFALWSKNSRFDCGSCIKEAKVGKRTGWLVARGLTIHMFVTGLLIDY